METKDFEPNDLLFFYNKIKQVAKLCYLKKVQISDDVYFDINQEELVNTKFKDDKNRTSIIKLDSELVFTITDKMYKSLVVENLQLAIKLEFLSKDNDFNGSSYALMKASIQYYKPIYFIYEYTTDYLGLRPSEIRVYSFQDLNSDRRGFHLPIIEQNLNIKDILVLLYVCLIVNMEQDELDKYATILIENFLPLSKQLKYKSQK